MSKNKKGKSVNTELEDKLKKLPETNDVLPEQKKTRIRRTKAEIEADKIAKARKILANSEVIPIENKEVGKELYTSLIYNIVGIKDRDVIDIPNVSADKLEDFNEIGIAYAKVINHYTKGIMTEGQMLIFSAVIGTIGVVSGRLKKVNMIKTYKDKIEKEHEKESVQDVRG